MKQLALLLVSFVFCGTSFAAINAGVQWELRTTGNDANGGGYDSTVGSPGTDFSQQDSAQVAFTDLVIGGTTTQLTSVAHPFGSTYPGNLIKIVSGSGCTTGWFEVLSVSGTTATMDRSVGTAASTCTGNLGGGLLTMAVALNNAQIISGNIAWVKSGTYTVSGSSISIAATAAPVTYTVNGYQTTHGDHTGTRPLVTSSTNSRVLWLTTAGTNTFIDNINFSSTAVTKGGCIQDSGTGGAVMVSNALFTTCNIAIDESNNASGAGSVWAYNVEIANDASDAIGAYYHAYLDSCYIHNSAGHGLTINAGGGTADIINSTFYANTGTTVVMNTGPATIINSNFVSNTSDGIVAPSGAQIIYLKGNVFYSNGGYGVNTTSNTIIVQFGANAWGSNTSGNIKNNTLGANQITLSADPFVAKASANFALNSTAGGGALLLKTGFPGVSTFGTGYLDIGAIQTSGGSGGGTIVSAYSN